MRSISVPLSLLAAATLTAGCAAPCDRYCDATADHIEYCMANSSRPDWETVNAGAQWEYWGAASKDEYTAACKEDLGAQLDGSEDADAVEGACEDEANRYEQMTDRSTCSDLP